MQDKYLSIKNWLIPYFATGKGHIISTQANRSSCQLYIRSRFGTVEINKLDESKRITNIVRTRNVAGSTILLRL
jgi:hypothetical protein